MGSRGRRRPFQAETGKNISISPPGSGPMYAIVYPEGFWPHPDSRNGRPGAQVDPGWPGSPPPTVRSFDVTRDTEREQA